MIENVLVCSDRVTSTVGFNPKRKADMTINLHRQLRWVWYGIGVWYIGLQVLADMNNFDDNDANAGLEIIQ